jgi:hypothetical protein
MEKAAGEVNVPRELLNNGADTEVREAAVYESPLSMYEFWYIVF